MKVEHADDDLVSFADEMGMFYEDLGLPRAWGRVLGWLLVCEPESQSAEDFANVLHGSRGSVSMTTRALIRSGMVERRTLRGDRRTYYRIRPESWTTVLEEQQQSTKRLRTLAERGLELLKEKPPEQRRRLEEMHSLMAFFEQELPALIDRWRRERDAQRE
jgi:DNA-binding transcriptional regulator GbsR (MarR family)